jgi:hypothetical protein
MNRQSLIRVSDPEMDMDRTVGGQAQPKRWRMFAAAQRWFAPRGLASSCIETPRRSVARELEPFASLPE